jgi:hypothetical protein
MKKLSLLLVFALLFGGCSGIRLVSDYDEVIDKGTTEFAEQFNTHVKNMGDLAGTAEGTYEANLKTYNALESKLDVLIARASATSEGVSCKGEKKVYERLKAFLKDKMPADMGSGATSTPEQSVGCNERLLVLVKDQLNFIKEIHKDKEQCGMNNMTCLRPAVAKTALSIANQSINAVSVVEAAKKQ